MTASAHRRAAFEAAEFLMDYLKTRAPFWKREHLKDGTVGAWVEAKEADDRAAGDGVDLRLTRPRDRMSIFREMTRGVRLMRSVVVFLSLIVRAPALAHEVPMSQSAQAPAHNPLDCYCRARGRMFAPGREGPA